VKNWIFSVFAIKLFQYSMNMGTIMDVTLDLLKKHNTGTPPHHFFFENAKILGGLDRSKPPRRKL